MFICVHAQVDSKSNREPPFWPAWEQTSSCDMAVGSCQETHSSIPFKITRKRARATKCSKKRLQGGYTCGIKVVSELRFASRAPIGDRLLRATQELPKVSRVSILRCTRTRFTTTNTTTGWRFVAESSWTLWHPRGSRQGTPTVHGGPYAGWPWGGPTSHDTRRTTRHTLSKRVFHNQVRTDT